MGTVVAVSLNRGHTFHKQRQTSIRLIEGIGVDGDAHSGTTVQHLYIQRTDPDRPNLRQVHLIHTELLTMLLERGFRVEPAELGENISTRGIDLLNLSEGTLLTIGEAVLRLTGTRTPCHQIDKFQPGLLRELIENKAARRFLAGVMSVVVRDGIVRPGDAIGTLQPEGTHRRLLPV